MTRLALSSFRALAASLFVAVALVLSVTAAGAESQKYDDAMLDAFAAAAIKVAAVRQQWIPKIEAAGSEEEAKKLGKQAVAQMRDVVNGTENMSVEQYNEIASAAQADEALRARVDARIKAQTGGE